ncbi:MAG: FeS cluster assembly scaffold protein NifU [Sedimentibacter sp.]|jgi:nitrogen fixation NifU-like protein|nr:FeS cluster assembly scaffold protein NifU [Sedimentibacter sp.]
MYTDIALDHISSPRNPGEIKDADGIGNIGNPTEGIMITVFIKVDKDILTDVTFKAFGCGAAIAAGSMMTVMAKGKTLEQAMTITNEAVSEALGGLPPQKLQCSNIAADALHNAIDDYKSKM